MVSFNKIYEGLILKQIKDLLLKYTLDAEEPAFYKYMDLYNFFDEIFYNTIFIQYGIKKLLIDK